MATLHLPAALSAHAGGRRRVEVAVPGPGTVAALLDAAGRDHPGVRQRVLDELGGLRPHVNVFVNGESIRYLDGLATPVGDGDEVWVVAAVSGG
jgi:molybdopterin synthase sulfur carrier subunit